MKWSNKHPELVNFKDDGYRTRARNMSPDALWVRQCLKYRTKVSSGCGVAFSGLMLLPTLGVSTLGLWVSGRTLDIARRKEKIIDEEVARRHLPNYERKKRDTLLPLGISIAVISALGVIDIICLTGTSSAVVSGIAPHGLNAIAPLLHHPGQFFIGAWHGFEFQAQQFFHVGGQHLAIGMDKFQTLTIHGMHVSEQVISGAPGHESAAAYVPATTEAQVVNTIHGYLAAGGSNAAMNAQAADQFLATAAAQGYTPQLAGIGVGMKIAEATEQHVAQFLIANTGLQGIWPSIAIGEKIEGENGDQTLKMQPLPNHDEIANMLYAQALTGETQRAFIFFSKTGQPVSQRIIAPPVDQKCQHAISTPTCRFCEESIDPQAQPYYHCCICSTNEQAFNICEVCVAGRGCSCMNRTEHILYREGLLLDTVSYGNLEEADVRKFKKRTDAGGEDGEVHEPERKDKEHSKWQWKKSKTPKDTISASEIEGNFAPVLEGGTRLEELIGNDSDSAIFIEDGTEFGRLFEELPSAEAR